MVNITDRKLEIFIGGTKKDLSEARKKLIEAVLDAHHIPSGMELWSAGFQPLRDDVSRYLKRCDVHIILLGARYGQCLPGENISYTEWEYRQSRRTDSHRPVIAFLLHNEDFEKARDEVINQDPDEKERTTSLNKLREELRRSRFCRFFHNSKDGIEELGRLCVNSVRRLIDSEDHSALPDTAGWMRADSDEARRLRDIRENPFLQRSIDRLRDFSILGERVAEYRVGKEVLAEVFWQQMKGRLRRHGFQHLFFESGSTIAYVSEQFEKLVLGESGDGDGWQITTNNVEVLLQLLLHTRLAVSRLPSAAPNPKDKYGAIFPPEWRDIEEAPPEEPRKLHASEARAVRTMTQLLVKARATLFLATTSAIDIDNREEMWVGPHIGSHPNMLFKRALFTRGCPVVLFLNAEKLGSPFVRGKCYPVFGPDFTWKHALAACALAIWVGYRCMPEADVTSRDHRRESNGRREDNDPQRITDILRGLGFTLVSEHRSLKGGVVVAENDRFRNVLPL